MGSQEFEELGCSHQAINGWLELGENETARAIASHNDPFPAGCFHQRLRVELGPLYLASILSSNMLKDVGLVHGNDDGPAPSLAQSQSSHGCTCRFVGQELTFVIHDENLLTPHVKPYPQVGMES